MVDDFAVDSDGRPLPLRPEEVRSNVMKMIELGTILAVVVQHDGNLAVQVFGPPSQELLAVLEQAATAYRAALKGH